MTSLFVTTQCLGTIFGRRNFRLGCLWPIPHGYAKTLKIVMAVNILLDCRNHLTPGMQTPKSKALLTLAQGVENAVELKVALMRPLRNEEPLLLADRHILHLPVDEHRTVNNLSYIQEPIVTRRCPVARIPWPCGCLAIDWQSPGARCVRGARSAAASL